MKLLPTFVAIVAVSCSQVFAQACVPIAERDIAPGYKVRVECDQYRKGTSTPKVPSLDDCAILCKNSGITGAVCSYSQTSKICVVAKPDAPLVSKAGIFLMTPIDDDDDKCPAELKTCEDNYAKCQADLNQAMQELNLKDQELTNEKDTVKKLQEELDEANKCCLNNGPGGSQPPSNQNPSGGNTEKPTHCGSSLSASGGQVSSGGNLQQCKARCLADPSCKAYAFVSGGPTEGGRPACVTYKQPTKDLKTAFSKRSKLYDITC
ncbi:hypothetical protein ACKRZS_001779 [Fusarium odoratissimum]